MKKIPTLFERDWDVNRSRVLDKIHEGCEWVMAGKGTATRKIDGTCCLIRGGKLYARRELKGGAKVPENFDFVAHDDETGKTVGWVPVDSGPEYCWHRQAFNSDPHADGTYELVGPHVQGNPEKYTKETLVSHEATERYPNVPRTFEGLREWLKDRNIEGLVFKHPDGRMAKIKLKDFGLRRVNR